MHALMTGRAALAQQQLAVSRAGEAAVDKLRLKTDLLQVHRQKNDEPTFGLSLDGLVTYLGYSSCPR